MKDQKIVNIRAFAILIVVLGHSVILYSNSWNLFETAYKVPVLNLLKELINLIQMPLFFSISGFLYFYSSQKQRKLMNFIKNKFFRLIVPYFCIAFLYMVPIRLAINFGAYENMNIFSIAREILLGNNNGHLWYLYALFVIFIIFYFIDKVLKQMNNDIAYIVALFIMAVLSINTYNFGFTFINNALQYSMWFYIGYLLNKYDVYKQTMLKIPVMVLAPVLVIWYLILPNQILGLFAGLLSVLFIYQTIPENNNQIINKISENSFGIYLFHSPLVYITYAYIPNAMPLWVVLLNFVVFGILSFYLSVGIKKTKLKFVIGE